MLHRFQHAALSRTNHLTHNGLPLLLLLRWVFENVVVFLHDSHVVFNLVQHAFIRYNGLRLRIRRGLDCVDAVNKSNWSVVSSWERCCFRANALRSSSRVCSPFPDLLGNLGAQDSADLGGRCTIQRQSSHQARQCLQTFPFHPARQALGYHRQPLLGQRHPHLRHPQQNPLELRQREVLDHPQCAAGSQLHQRVLSHCAELRPRGHQETQRDKMSGVVR
mmetsp:Transcript_85826/g.229632  ORF Transcript_85826/g.229632 Transcript_85826/m.229632 type:complete len:220 (-) Transcript_85826:629-1288(-)